jgi:hypothetical protein
MTSSMPASMTSGWCTTSRVAGGIDETAGRSVVTCRGVTESHGGKSGFTAQGFAWWTRKEKLIRVIKPPETGLAPFSTGLTFLSSMAQLLVETTLGGEAEMKSVWRWSGRSVVKKPTCRQFISHSGRSRSDAVLIVVCDRGCGVQLCKATSKALAPLCVSRCLYKRQSAC